MKKRGYDTMKEILQQPEVWDLTYKTLLRERDRLKAFIMSKGFGKDASIIFTGAGSSEYCADVATSIYLKDGYSKARTFATTDIVSTPEYCLSPEKRFMISFARSGDSPESVAAYDIVRKYCPGSAHLIITCNKDGLLAKTAISEDDFVIKLPPQSNDKSLAMTSSFSSMLMAVILCKNLDNMEIDRKNFEDACKFGQAFFAEDIRLKIEEIAKKNIYRAVFLGSGALKGIARECHLKLQELTDGAVMCSYDSFMGLRHGPKAVIHDDTLVVYLLSDNPKTRQYEYDLIEQVNAEHNPAAQILVSARGAEAKGRFDLIINGDMEETNSGNEYIYVPYVIIGQLLGWYFSIRRGLDPDTPSVSGAISRVVNGVKSYEI